MSELRARAVAALRRLLGDPAFPPFGRLVRPWPAFVARELSRRHGTFVYRLSGSAHRVALRHGSGDPATLTEVFHLRYYDLPADVVAAIGEPQTILDLGANIGLFGLLAMARWPSAKVVAYEPDPANAAVHERTVTVNGLGGRWTLVQAAAGARDGEVRFVAGLDALSHVMDAGAGPVAAADAGAASGHSTIAVALRDVLEQVGSADLVKLDIEGGEWDILGDPRFRRRPPRAIVLEYHPRQCPGSDPRAAAERALRDAGMRTAEMWHGDDGHGMLWGWRA